ncbi:cache domain-containing protein [Desulfovibrio sp. OttesenSCG-928-F07]|nr:cache domain-containing protein [Desulfovibrio sp. OttesenSCG-928-F07]
MARYKENFLHSLAECASSPAKLATKAVLGLALCAFLAACIMYLHGRSALSELTQAENATGRPLSQAAQSEGIRISTEVLASVLAKEATGAENINAALAASLTKLYPDLAENGYFILWQGTVAVCSPLTPDTAGTDFGNLQDAAGQPFVRELKRVADSGGGFSSFTLLQQRNTGATAYGLAPNKEKSEVSLKIPYIAYSTPVYGTNLHLTLWRKAVPSAQYNLHAELAENNDWSVVGLFMAGISFLGVSVLLRNFEK